MLPEKDKHDKIDSFVKQFEEKLAMKVSSSFSLVESMGADFVHASSHRLLRRISLQTRSL